MKIRCSRVTRLGQRLGPAHDVIVTFSDRGKVGNFYCTVFEIEGREFYSLSPVSEDMAGRERADAKALLAEGIDISRCEFLDDAGIVTFAEERRSAPVFSWGWFYRHWVSVTGRNHRIVQETRAV